MRHKKLILIPVIIVLLSTFIIIPVTAVDTLREYLNSGGDGDSQAIYSGNWTAQQFTTANVSHKIQFVNLSLKRVGNPGTVTVSIREADASHYPTGYDICSGTVDGDTFSTTYSFIPVTFDVARLEGTTEYTIVVRALAGDNSNYVLWQSDSGGGLDNAVGVSSNDGGAIWSSDTPADYLFEVWGDDCLAVNGAGVFTSYIEDDDMLFTVDYLAEYPPYYPTDDSATYFDLQLCASDNISDVISSVPLVDWGRRPGSLYLSASMATGITYGDEYYIRIISAVDPDTVVVSYQLQDEDWYGSDLSYLDRWCIRLAHEMEEYYSSTFVEYVSGKGEVLNEQGGIMFDAGINGLSYVRPDLFKTTVNNPTYTLPTYTDAYEDYTDWETQVGATVSGFFDDVGDLIGMDGRGAMGVSVGIGILALSLLFGKFLFGIILAMPIAFWATEMRIIPISVLVIIGAISVVFFVGNYIWSRM